jgi:hypothetical protein
MPWLITQSEMEDMIPTGNPQALVDAAAAQIYSHGFDALTFLGEFRETRNMFKNILLGTVKAIKKTPSKHLAALMKSKPLSENVRKGTSLASNLLLEARYGWRPLMYDYQDFNKALANLSLERKRFSQRAGLSQSEVSQETGYTNSGAAYHHWTSTTEWLTSLRGSVVADIDPPQFAFNPFKTGWELVTLSFVLDWFVNVGAAIDAISFLLLSRHHTAAYGYSIRATRSGTITSSNPVAGYTAGECQVYNYSDATMVQRFPCSVSGIPHINVRLNDLKVADLLALVRQRILR